MKFAPRLGERSQLHAKKRTEVTPWGEIWGVGTGSYSHQLFLNEPLVTRHHERELVGTERRLFDQLGKVMAVKDHTANPSPTVLLDLGGMFGLSLARFAAQPGMHEKIDSGQLALVISNLSLQVDQALLLQNKRPDNLSRDDIALLKEQRQWLQYINGDAAQLRRTEIQLHDGARIHLEGNADIVHERFALSHGVKNDIDIPRVGKLLSPYGSLWLSSAALMEDHQIERLKEDAIGRDNLIELGLSEVDFQRRKSPYHIFKKPACPAIL